MMQRRGREFLATKHRRCKLMEEDWHRIEDKELQLFFHNYQAQILREEASKAEAKMAKQRKGHASQRGLSLKSTSSVALVGQMKQMFEDGLMEIDWRSYKIPTAERQQALSRYYTASLRKNIRMQSGLHDALMAAVEKQRELCVFLGHFGATADQAADFTRESAKKAYAKPPPPYWHVNEEVALQLIALCAQALSQKGHFAEHPANRNLPGNVMYRRPLKITEGSEGLSTLETLDRLVGRHMNRPQEVVAPKPEEKKPQVKIEVEKSKATDLESLIEGFTPRLQKIADEQCEEYRLISAAADGQPVPGTF